MICVVLDEYCQTYIIIKNHDTKEVGQAISNKARMIILTTPKLRYSKKDLLVTFRD